MEKTTTNQIRQVLMNELGLDRAYIRELVEQVVRETVEKHIVSMDERNIIGRMVSDEFKKLCQKGRYDPEPIKAIVREEAQRQVAEFISQNLKFLPEIDG